MANLTKRPIVIQDLIELFYQIHPEAVEIIRVLHGAQNLEFILEQ